MSDEDRQDEPEDLDKPPSFFPYDENTEEVSGFEGSTEPIKVRVEAVFTTQGGEGNQFFVLLSDGHRKLPIVIGQSEASSIILALEDKQPDRPMTHDLMKNILVRMGAEVDRVVIDDLWGATYYAKIFIKHNGAEFMIDSRPSDGVALALRTGATVYVADGILEQHGS